MLRRGTLNSLNLGNVFSFNREVTLVYLLLRIRDPCHRPSYVI